MTAEIENFPQDWQGPRWAAVDCRTCEHCRDGNACAISLWGCTNGDQYQALPPVRLWRVAP